MTATVPFRFSTDDLPESSRLAVWREVLGRVHLRMDVSPLGDAPVRSVIEQHAWGSASLYFAESNAVEASRTKELLNDGNGDFRLLSVRGTGFEIVTNGTTESLCDGDAVLLFSGVASTVRYLGPNNVTAIRLPRTALALAVPTLDERPIRRIHPAAQSRLQLLLGYVSLLRSNGPQQSRTVADNVGRHLADLAAFALERTDSVRERVGRKAIREARLATIRADALANLSKASLSARTMARRHGVTDRHIHQLFEPTGETFGSFVERERMKRAFALLTDPTSTDMRIGDIALSVGYCEHSNFDRAFRRCFGDSPRNVRRRRIRL
jgi:AraC-like DNA-binding protein